ncbi:uncharacterized protein EV420DRAFT_1574567 [Desarmillaria tabescens]|uniref:Uncharacterized protein n=1 Tax=Armillaria tabescens TaxID=1929756 RepID=A0AA39JQ93_ARMTA|nr:uncharacterized protein EV420DRAFT_1574567 [Desarmillaria tabescens]KAK0444568.1 hypothetical protein EV420DRAFT_1574567 [Desarmillaria tabescens]
MSGLDATKSPADLSKKKESLQKLTDQRRAKAWEVHRWPLVKMVARKRTRIHLPASYMAKDGETTRIVYPGSDINQLVHIHYLKQWDGGGVAANFVHADGIDSKRNEYLGPDPRVAGYWFDDDDEIHVKWWDGFLKDQWMDSEKWSVEVVWDGEKWTEK